MRRRSRSTMATITAALMVAGLAAPAAAATATEPPRAAFVVGDIVQTDKGALRGRQQDTVRTFEGIPFAAPPVGDLRFAAPQPASQFQGTLDATAPRSPCPQIGAVYNPVDSVEEDCLFLNVTVPNGARTSDGLPVMVFLHGGSYLTGTGAAYDSSKLAVQGDVVVVTLNYRLGPVGFLANPALSAQDPAAGSGNYGLLDQQAALAWVQRNIEAFAGDSTNVTLFGESAGASAVCANIASPTAAGTFQRAIAQSYSCTAPYPPLQTAEQTGAAFAAKVGCTVDAEVASCLRALPVEELLAAWDGGGPVVGGASLPVQPAKAIATGKANELRSFMHGNTRDENRLFVPAEVGTSITVEQYEQRVRSQYGEDADAVLQRYPASAYPSPLLALTTLASDAGTRLSTCDHVQAYDLLTGLTQPVPTFAYQFRDRTSSPLIDFPNFDEGAAHAQELPFLFPGLFGAPLTAEQQQLSDAMVGYWTSFATDGNPNGAGTPAWASYAHGSGVVQGLDLASAGGIAPVDVATESNCAFFAALAGPAQPAPAPAPDFTAGACPPATLPPSPFTDVTGDSLPDIAVRCLAAKGITVGRADGSYGPAAIVARGQMVLFLARYAQQAGVSLPAGDLGAFSDSAELSPEVRAAAAGLAAAGVVKGRPDGSGGLRLDPTGLVSRGQMAAFLVRLERFVRDDPQALPAAAGNPFTDAGDTFAQEITALASVGVAQGDTSTTFAPDRPVTRQQMALFLARLLQFDLVQSRTTIARPLQAVMSAERGPDAKGSWPRGTSRSQTSATMFEGVRMGPKQPPGQPAPHPQAPRA